MTVVAHQTDEENYWAEKVLRPDQVKVDQLVWLKIFGVMSIIEEPAVITAASAQRFTVRLLDGTERRFTYETALSETSIPNRRHVWVVDPALIDAYFEHHNRRLEKAVERAINEAKRSVKTAKGNLKRFKAMQRTV